MSFIVRVLLCVSLFNLGFQAQTFANTLQIFVDPFQNRVFRWDGKTLTSEQDSLGSISVSDSEIETTAPPLVWADHEILLLTKQGILKFDTRSKQTTSIYESKEKGMDSLTLGGVKKAYFIEHTRDEIDNLMELTSQGVRLLVSQIPTSSGPIWIRPDGTLGLSSASQGIFSIPIPQEKKQFSELSYSTIPNEMKGILVTEGQTSQKESRFGIFDSTSVSLYIGGSYKKIADATAAAFDPCSGWIWYLDPQGALQSYVSGGNPYANDLPVNPRQCPVITSWEVLERSGSKINSDRLDVLQGFPSGTRRIPSTLVVTLGNRGVILLESNHLISASGQTDLRVFENAFEHPGGTFVEPALVEIWDGTRWVSTGCDCNNPTLEKCAGMQVTHSFPGNGITPWSDQAGGFPIQLNQFGIKTASKFRITDCEKGSLGSNRGAFAGFDLNAISVSPQSLGPEI